jgi:hypothetical protein
LEDLAPEFGERAAQAIGDQRLRLLPEPAGGGFAFEQIRDGWQRSKQILFLMRHVIDARLHWPVTIGDEDSASEAGKPDKDCLFMDMNCWTSGQDPAGSPQSEGASCASL